MSHFTRSHHYIPSSQKDHSRKEIQLSNIFYLLYLQFYIKSMFYFCRVQPSDTKLISIDGTFG